MQISNSVKLAIDNATKFAKSVGADKIEPEHLLFGLLFLEDSKSVQVFSSLGVNKKVYHSVALRCIQKGQGELKNEIELSKQVSNIFAKSSNFSEKNGSKIVEIDEILYFLIADRPVIVIKILNDILKLNVNSILLTILLV